MGFLPPRRSLLMATAWAMVLAATGAQVTVANYDAEKITSIKTINNDPARMSVLEPIDRVRYRQAFRLERMGKHADADRVLSRVDNVMLKDAVFAVGTKGGDAASMIISSLDAPAPTHAEGNKIVSSGYARSQLFGHKQWLAAVNAYRLHNPALAAKLFTAMADGAEKLTGEDRAAAAFWAYRSLKQSGNNAAASRYLRMAADAAPSFYSLIASAVLGEKMGQTDPAIVPTEADLKALQHQPAAGRAIALNEIGEKMLAENELRTAFIWADRSTRTSLLYLAKQWNMPSVQMQMTSGTRRSADAFPVPSWEPSSGYQLERALLFAIMRQESGFNPNARSTSGAIGLMQLMPGTMQDMAAGSQVKGNDPAVNISLGQRYVEHLMETPQIGDNLIYILSAYNAGPGTVINWLRADGVVQHDPLLFVESIPNAQTREYVQHVIANYWVYSELLGKGKSPSLSAMAGGNWPRYEGAERQLVSLLTQAD